MSGRQPMLRGAVAVLVVLGLAGCAGLPSSGQVRNTPISPQQLGQVRTNSQGPNDKMGPVDIVNGFLTAMTGDDRDPTFAVAQQYLTQSAKHDEWPLKDGTTILASPPSVSAEQGSGDTVSPTSTTATVDVSDYTVVGTLNANGYYKPAYTPPSASPAQPYEFGLIKAKGPDGVPVWRIDQVPPERLVDLDSFLRAYPSPLPVYLPTGPGGGPVISQVYVTQSPNVADVYTGLVRALLAGPPSGSLGSGGSRPAGVLAAPVTVDPTGAVDVTVQSFSPAGQPADLARAIYQTLATSAQVAPQLNSAQPINGVKVRFLGPGGKPGPYSSPQQGPIGEPGPPNLYLYLTYDDVVYRLANPAASGSSNGVLPSGSAAIAAPSEKVPGSFGEPQNIKQIAVLQKDSTAISKLGSSSRLLIAAALTDGVVVEGDDAANATAAKVWYQSKAPATGLAWDPTDGSLWIVDHGQVVNVRSDGQTTLDVSVDPGQYLGPSVQGMTVQKIRISPDGQQAVLIYSTPGSASAPGSASVAVMASITRFADGTVPQLQPRFQLQLPIPGTTNPQVPYVDDAAWAGHRVVVVLSRDPNSGSQTTRQFYADGSQDSQLAGAQSNAPTGATQVATSLDRNGVSVYTDGTAASGGSAIFRKDLSNEAVVLGAAPVFPTLLVAN